MTYKQNEIFSQLCEEDLALHSSDGDGIGTYNEKRLHRILKRLITENAECYEVKVGKYIADVLERGRITEIQTGCFRTLTDKIEFYLNSTELDITVLHPIICEKKIIRADKETGEIIKISRSTKKERPSDALAELYFLKNLVPDDRLTVRLLHVGAEEYRFSEMRRYCREGRYDSDLRPVAITGETVLRSVEDWKGLIPEELYGVEFSASDFERATRLRGRRRYYALSALVDVGILKERAEGRRRLYKVIL